MYYEILQKLQHFNTLIIVLSGPWVMYSIDQKWRSDKKLINTYWILLLVVQVKI